MKITSITTLILTALLLLPLTTTTTVTAAHAQEVPPSSQPPIAVTPPTDTELVDSEQIIREIRNMLFYSHLEDYRLYDNGTAEYIIRLTTSQDAPMNKTITVITEHEYTPANRYVFDNTTGDIITPQGEKLVISTFD